MNKTTNYIVIGILVYGSIWAPPERGDAQNSDTEHSESSGSYSLSALGRSSSTRSLVRSEGLGLDVDPNQSDEEISDTGEDGDFQCVFNSSEVARITVKVDEGYPDVTKARVVERLRSRFKDAPCSTTGRHMLVGCDLDDDDTELFAIDLVSDEPIHVPVVLKPACLLIKYGAIEDPNFSGWKCDFNFGPNLPGRLKVCMPWKFYPFKQVWREYPTQQLIVKALGTFEVGFKYTPNEIFRTISETYADQRSVHSHGILLTCRDWEARKDLFAVPSVKSYGVEVSFFSKPLPGMPSQTDIVVNGACEPAVRTQYGIYLHYPLVLFQTEEGPLDEALRNIRRLGGMRIYTPIDQRGEYEVTQEFADLLESLSVVANFMNGSL